MQPKSPSLAWDDYRFWSRLRLAGILLFLPAMELCLFLARRFGAPKPSVWLFAGAWFVCVLLVPLYRAGSFTCPRCGRHFFIAAYRRNLLTKRCMNCDLPKWATTWEGRSAS